MWEKVRARKGAMDGDGMIHAQLCVLCHHHLSTVTSRVGEGEGEGEEGREKSEDDSNGW